MKVFLVSGETVLFLPFVQWKANTYSLWESSESSTLYLRERNELSTLGIWENKVQLVLLRECKVRVLSTLGLRSTIKLESLALGKASTLLP